MQNFNCFCTNHNLKKPKVCICLLCFAVELKAYYGSTLLLNRIISPLWKISIHSDLFWARVKYRKEHKTRVRARVRSIRQKRRQSKGCIRFESPVWYFDNNGSSLRQFFETNLILLSALNKKYFQEIRLNETSFKFHSGHF